MSQHLAPRAPRHLGRRLLSWATTGLLVVATLAGLAYLAPSLFGYERYVITGGSMTGTYDKGSIAFEKKVPVEDLKVGDVITYVPPASSGVSTLVTHRIITMKKLDTGVTQFRTKGDANPDPDSWTFQLVDGEQPVVQHHVPHLGWVFVALADREIRMLVVGVPAGLIALLSAVELVRAVTARRPEADLADDHLPVVTAI